MSDEPALRAAVAADPANVLHRLVLADWLDDHDREPEAELVRLLCDDDRWPVPGAAVVGWFHRARGWPLARHDDWVRHARTAAGCPPGREAVRELYTLPGPWRPAEAVQRIGWAWLDLPALAPGGDRLPPAVLFDRGYWEARLPLRPPTRRERLWNAVGIGSAFGALVGCAGAAVRSVSVPVMAGHPTLAELALATAAVIGVAGVVAYRKTGQFGW